MGPLIPLFWTSRDVCPGFQSQGGFPCLCASSPVHNRFLRFTSSATPAFSTNRGVQCICITDWAIPSACHEIYWPESSTSPITTPTKIFKDDQRKLQITVAQSGEVAAFFFLPWHVKPLQSVKIQTDRSTCKPSRTEGCRFGGSYQPEKIYSTFVFSNGFQREHLFGRINKYCTVVFYISEADLI